MFAAATDAKRPNVSRKSCLWLLAIFEQLTHGPLVTTLGKDGSLYLANSMEGSWPKFHDGTVLGSNFMVKYDTLGNILWKNSRPLRIHAMDVDSNDDVYVTGESYGNFYFGNQYFGPNDYGLFVGKYNKNGVPQWGTIVTTGNAGGGIAYTLKVLAPDSLELAGAIGGDTCIIDTAKYHIGPYANSMFMVIKIDTSEHLFGVDTANNTLDISGITKPDKIKLVPNPAQNEINILHGVECKKITLINTQGTTLLSYKIDAAKETSTLDIAALPKGIYLVELADRDGRQRYTKFIKQ